MWLTRSYDCSRRIRSVGVRTLNIILVVVFIIDVVSILDVNLESLTVRREIIKAITRKRSVQLGSASVALLSFPDVQ